MIRLWGFTVLAVCLSATANAEQYCMDVDPARIDLIDEALPLRNARNATNLTRNEFISQAVKEAVELELRQQAVLAAIAQANAEQRRLEELVAEQAAEQNTAVDTKLGDW